MPVTRNGSKFQIFFDCFKFSKNPTKSTEIMPKPKKEKIVQNVKIGLNTKKSGKVKKKVKNAGGSGLMAFLKKF